MMRGRSRRRGIRGVTLGIVSTAILSWAPGALPGQFLTAREVLARDPVPPDFEIAYGSGSNQFGHLRVPDAPGPHPVVVILHGGCWRAFADLDYLGSMAADLTANGVATWNLEFRRIDSPGSGWPATFLDVGRGIDHLRELAQRHDLDLDRVVTVGHSSGGHLALWAAARRRIPASSPLWVDDPLPIAGAVSVSGPGMLAPFREVDQRVCGGDVIDALLGGSPDEVPSRYEAAAPVRLLPIGVPQRLLTGASDGVVPPRFADSYEEAARAAGDDAVSIVLAGAAHFEPVAPETDAFPRVREAILALVERRQRSPDRPRGH